MADYIQDLRRLVGQTKIIMVIAGAFVFNEKHHILLYRRSDNGYWGLPRGIIAQSLHDGSWHTNRLPLSLKYQAEKHNGYKLHVP
ncbi:hypothetical protein AB4114_07275 [Paenibacillus sp. 2RAB27]|uniref:hypothetical protein n=1 Tax=Paenibacillus sp. 2RAB27 TaxID=3232991 RepID=UPI003F9E8A9C